MSLDLPANINMTLDARHFCVMLTLVPKVIMFCLCKVLWPVGWSHLCP